MMLVIGLSVASPSAAHAAPGVNQPTSYFPSDASLTTTPTYQTPRAARSGSGVLNGQDYDHYCKANWYGSSIVGGNTSGQKTAVTAQVSKRSTVPALAGNNGLLYMNQFWGNSQTQPQYRVVWATDYATTNSKLTIKIGDNWNAGSGSGATFTPLSTDPATLLGQIAIVPGAAHFRTYDWATYTLGLQSQAPYAGTDHYIPGPYTGLNTNLFVKNPNVRTQTQAGFNDPFYPDENEYLVNTDPTNPRSFANRITYDPATKSITIDLGNQEAGAMITFGIGGQATSGFSTTNTSEAYQLEATFTGDYVTTDATNTVCYPTQVSWTKTDGDTGAPLAGSAWALTPTGDAARVTTATAVPDTAGTGSFLATTANTASAVQPGTWSLTETKAPTGYSPISTPIPSIRLDFEHQSVDLGNLTNTNAAPVITAQPVSVDQDATFNPLSGVTANDAEDGVITNKIVVSNLGGFDVHQPGAYTITYSVTDAGGKTSTVTRVVTVVARPISTPSPTQSSTPTQPPTPTPTTQPGANLADTGSSVSPWLLLGAGVLILGGAGVIIRTVVASRRRRP